MKIKILLIFVLANAFVFSQSANTKTTNSALMQKTVKAFQIKSENKIDDFYNLLNVLGNPNVKKVLKQQTILEITKLFIDKKIEVPNFLSIDKNLVDLNIFLNTIASSKEKIFFQVDNKMQSYVHESDEKQSWTIGYDLNISSGKAKHTIKNVMQNVLLVQEEKQFGNVTKTVQKSFFGTIWIK